MEGHEQSETEAITYRREWEWSWQFPFLRRVTIGSVEVGHMTDEVIAQIARDLASPND